MKKSILFIVAAFIAILVVSSCAPKQKSETQTVTKEDTIKNGEYLVTIMGCDDCHSPKKMGPNGPEIIPDLKLSGYPSTRPLPTYDAKVLKDFILLVPDLTSGTGPWGTSFAANLTPDVTGIGNWTEENFKIALTKGKFKGIEGSRSLLPPMPWQSFINLKDNDLKAIFAYLKSIKPVNNLVPEPILPAGSK